jgi:hypothetical protein
MYSADFGEPTKEVDRRSVKWEFCAQWDILARLEDYALSLAILPDAPSLG